LNIDLAQASIMEEKKDEAAKQIPKTTSNNQLKT
jgi:hypothetical protein